MNRMQMGRVIAHLTRYRHPPTHVKAKARSDERELARILVDASADDRADIDGILQGMGFDLVHMDAFKTQGLAPDANLFLLVRRLGGQADLFSERLIDERMAVRNDSVTARRVWFVQCWFVLMAMLYTQRNRVPGEVSRYVETAFSRADLVQAMHDYINDMVRKLDQEQLANDAVYRCLVGETGSLVDKYVDRFLALMVDGALLDRQGDDRYTQSLLGAVEIKNNSLQGLEPWLQSAGATTGPLEIGRELLLRPQGADAALEN